MPPNPPNWKRVVVPAETEALAKVAIDSCFAVHTRNWVPDFLNPPMRPAWPASSNYGESDMSGRCPFPWTTRASGSKSASGPA